MSKILTFLAVVLILATSSSGNQMTNGSMEDDVDNDNVPDGWILGSYTYVEDDAAGAQDGEDYITGVAFSNLQSPTITIPAAGEYVISVWYRYISGDPSLYLAPVINGTEDYDLFYPNNVDWVERFYTYNLSAGDTVAMWFREYGVHAFDNVTVTPEPVSLALVGLGIGGLLLRRKRR